MARKYYGTIGFLKLVEQPGSIWEEEIVERPYKGDVLRFSVQYPKGEGRNSDVKLSNEIQIVADSFAYQNAHLMKYVSYLNANWEITNITVDRPRITLSIGGEYNGPKTSS